MAEDVKKQVQRQFGDKAEAYATSALHARGSSLQRLVELLQPQPHWQALDIATAAGHTAHVLAPHVAWMVATDLTAQMLPKARSLAAEKGLENVTVAAADAEALPFAGGTFDLVTCRIAPHHFPDVDQFMAEAVRVLRPGGRLAVVDNIVPGSRLRGKKGRVQRQAGEYVNAFEKLRDPSHARCLSFYEWQDAFARAGLAIEHQESERKQLDFNDYAARMNVSPDNRLRLRAMLVQAPREALEFLTPLFQGDTIKFYLSEALFIGRKD